MVDLSQKGMKIKKASFEDEEHRYMGTVVQDRIQFSYEGTNFDIARDKSMPRNPFLTGNR